MPPQSPTYAASRIPLSAVMTLVPLAAALNIVGATINVTLKLPTFLDMIGTAVAAIVLGPWWGALAGVMTNVGGSFINGPVELPFALANVTGALVWGYGVRSLGLGSNLPKFFLLNIVVALAVTAVAAPIVVFVFGGATGHTSDILTAAFVQAGRDLTTSVFASTIVVTLADKVVAGFVALSIIAALPRDLTDGLRLPAKSPTRTAALAGIGAAIGAALVVIYVLVGQPTA